MSDDKKLDLDDLDFSDFGHIGPADNDEEEQEIFEFESENEIVEGYKINGKRLSHISSEEFGNWLQEKSPFYKVLNHAAFTSESAKENAIKKVVAMHIELRDIFKFMANIKITQR